MSAALAALGVLVVLAVAVLALSPKSEDVAPRSGPAVSARDRAVEGMVAHLDELQRIAGEHGGNRAAGTPGDRASVAYWGCRWAPPTRYPSGRSPPTRTACAPSTAPTSRSPACTRRWCARRSTTPPRQPG